MISELQSPCGVAWLETSETSIGNQAHQTLQTKVVKVRLVLICITTFFFHYFTLKVKVFACPSRNIRFFTNNQYDVIMYSSLVALTTS